ncbi:hypothetical protein Asp14428_73470 [Actinoplanes sp. NBRC 14428]|nr:hypothetical protein Asp14428_33200 [Actinoplanes sp. NBRC 14428]BCJ55872.1 hypothetical protein Asp14428_73470 [Actinoplanes sp. NBRC 14428]
MQPPPSANPLPPFPMHRAFPGSEYYGGSAPHVAFGSRCAYPGPSNWPPDVQEPQTAVPVFTVIRSAE